MYFQYNCVDVEYNRFGVDKESKRLEVINHFLLESDWVSHNEALISDFYKFSNYNYDDFKKAMKKIFNNVKRAKLVKPDIIVHKHGMEDNLLI